MKRKNMLLVVLLMAVGFAAVSTTLYINGSTKINANQDDFNVYYSNAYVNGVQDKSVITDDTHISFTTELSKLGEKYVLDYEVTNGSKNYDAELVMECTQSNDYLSVTNEFDDDSILKAKAIREGKLTLELIKSNTGDDIEVTIDCTINANAIERDSLGIENRSEITVEAVDSNNTNLNAKAYEITGTEETKLLDSLVETGYVSDASEVDALIEVKSDDFEDFATTTFDVSSIASQGDKVVILHFNESTQEWEYVSEEIVDANGKVTSDFTSYSPVAFVVKKEDGDFVVLVRTIKLDPIGGELTESTLTVINNNMIGDLPNPTKTGYTFVGWYTELSGGVLIESNYVVKSNMLLYAHWEKKSVWSLSDDKDKDGIPDIGDLITVGSESFYVYSNDGSDIKAIARYNLYVGGVYNGYTSKWTSYSSEEATGLQNVNMTGISSSTSNVRTGTTAYTAINSYLINYKKELQEMGATIKDVTLITLEEINKLGNVSFIRTSSYWTKTYNSNGSNTILVIRSYTKMQIYNQPTTNNMDGVRPVIVISSDEVL